MTHKLLLCLLLLTSCDKEPARPYRIEATMQVDGRTRHYLLYLPSGYYDNSSQYALVLGLHRGGGSAVQFDRHYGLTQKADASKFIVVYPEGVRSDGPLGVRTWNAGTCCDYAVEHQIDDVKYIRQLIDQLTARYRIDTKRVYATGMSNGGMLAYRLACEMPEKIAAIAAVSCTMVATDCHPARAVPVLHLHSVLDETVPPEGGIGIRGYYFPPVDSALNVFAFGASPVIVKDDAEYKLTKWGDRIEYYLTKDGGHAWPGAVSTTSWGDEPSSVIHANDLLWEFFQRHALE
jgi:polyhydroxybutyrate depolymerase